MIKQFIGFVRKMQLKTLKAFGSGLNDKDFRISICDNNLEIASILAKVFEGMQEVEVLHGKFDEKIKGKRLKFLTDKIA